VVATSPSAGEVGVARERSIAIRFDRLLRPASVLRQSIVVSPGLVDPSTNASPAGNYFFLPSWDPYERVATFRLQPGSRWYANTLHTVVVLPPAEPSSPTGIRAFDGAGLEQSSRFTFTASAAVSEPDVDDAAPVADWCHEEPGPPALPPVRGALTRCIGCHGGAAPQAGLDLSSAAAVARTARGVLSSQVVPMEHAGSTSETPLNFGQGMPRIAPGNPGNSYLLYKLLINPANYPAADDPAATDPYWERGLGALQAPSHDEIARLRDAFVWMEPMPPSGGLTAGQMRALVAWIALGAQVRDCP
jgi:hypothetical protein